MWLTPYFFKFLCVIIMEFTFESFKEELQYAKNIFFTLHWVILVQNFSLKLNNKKKRQLPFSQQEHLRRKTETSGLPCQSNKIRNSSK